MSKVGKTFTFNNWMKSDSFNKFDGLKCEVLGPLNDPAAESADMLVVRMLEGYPHVLNVFDDELVPLDTERVTV